MSRVVTRAMGREMAMKFEFCFVQLHGICRISWISRIPTLAQLRLFLFLFDCDHGDRRDRGAARIDTDVWNSAVRMC
jgi:hypothetical protein